MKTRIPGKDEALEDTIEVMTNKLEEIGIKVEIVSWLNPIPNVWSVHVRDSESPMCFSNGKGASKNAALASALGEYFERISCNYFYADWFFGKEIAESDFCHYPNEKWFKPSGNDLPAGLLDDKLFKFYNPENELKVSTLVDTNSGNKERGICALPFIRQSDQSEVFIPVNIIGNLYVSNGMSAGNNKFEARVQCLSEIFERYVKNKIIFDQISLPDIPKSTLVKYPNILKSVEELEKAGYPVLLKDASLGGKFPVINVTLMNPKNGGVFASFGAHPRFEVALERTLTELLQGRSLETLDVVQAPSFNEYAVCNHDNLEDHFIDSTGVISWKFFNKNSDYEFSDWDFKGSTAEEYDYLMNILSQMEKEVYIADYNHLDVSACRIIVPDMSEIYTSDDLIWDNNNRSLAFRSDILNLHSLSDEKLLSLRNNLEESELDDQMPISELIGVVFNKDSLWKKTTIGELKMMIDICNKDFDRAQVYCEMVINFEDLIGPRVNYFRVLNTLLEIQNSEELDFLSYKENLERLYSVDLVTHLQNVINGKVKFDGLEKLSESLEGLDEHKQLINSFEKLRAKMKKNVSLK